MDFIYKKSGNLFNLHPYWTKQPIEPISFFIKKYTEEGDTILDPFCGTGTVGLAARLNNRNCILSDISPICRHISMGYTTNFNIVEKKKEIDKLINEIEISISHLYKTKCTYCKKERDIKYAVVYENSDFEEENNLTPNEIFTAILQNKSYCLPKNKKFVSFDLIKVCYVCNCKDKKIYKEPDKDDYTYYNSELYLNNYYPTNEFFGNEPKRNFKKGITEVHQLYSKRNLSALSILYNKISKCKDSEIKNLFLFAFTSILFNCSLLSRFRYYENTSIKMGTFYIPVMIKDNNVLSSFNNKLNLLIKTNLNLYKNTSSSVKIINNNADKLSSIKDNSIDYIYTDPPYTDVISYSELNIVWESWLKEVTNVKDELVVNKFQNKDINYYSRRFELFLFECYRVLKDGKHLTLVFHHPKIEHWMFIQKAIFNSRFNLYTTEIPTRIISNNKTSSQHNTNKNSRCFLVLDLVKSEERREVLQELSDDEFIDLIKRLVKKSESAGYVATSDMYDFILNHIINKYVIRNFTLP